MKYELSCFIARNKNADRKIHNIIITSQIHKGDEIHTYIQGDPEIKYKNLVYAFWKFCSEKKEYFLAILV